MSDYYDTTSPEVLKLWQEKERRDALTFIPEVNRSYRTLPWAERTRRRLKWSWYGFRERLARWIFPEGDDV